ncbi:MAG: hypothetical protein ABF535_10495, partial [Acetobacter sp.]
IAITILPYIENKNDIDAISGTVNNIRDSPVRGADIRRTKTAARLLRREPLFRWQYKRPYGANRFR